MILLLIEMLLIVQQVVEKLVLLCSSKYKGLIF